MVEGTSPTPLAPHLNFMRGFAPQTPLRKLPPPTGVVDSAERIAPGAMQRKYNKLDNKRKQSYSLYVFADVFTYLLPLHAPLWFLKKSLKGGL